MILTPNVGGNENQTNKKVENVTDNIKKSELDILSVSEIVLDLVQDFGSIKLYNILDKQGKKIGFINISQEKNAICIIDIKINKKERNKGYGKMTYKEIVRLYKLPLISYISSPEADHVRQSLEKEGLAYTDKKGGRRIRVKKIIGNN